MRKTTLALAAALAMTSGLLATPALAAGAADGDSSTDWMTWRGYYGTSYVTTYPSTYYTAYPSTYYVPVVPAPVVTAYPYGTTTTYYTTPSVAYVPPPVYPTTTVIETRYCNPYDVARPGVNTACN